MKSTHWAYMRWVICASIISCLIAAESIAAPTADPAVITFTSSQQSVIIKLTNNGAPIAAKDIQGWRFLASGHDYKHMLSIESSDGALKITPDKSLEAGSFNLVIETPHGPINVQVLAPLSDVPDIVERMSALSGQSEEKIKEKLGLLTSTGREEIEINLPPVYYEGQTLELTMPVTPGSERIASWFINGELLANGQEQHVLTYTFKTPGEYILTYIETAVIEGKSVVVAGAKEHIRVVPVPSVLTEVAVNTEIHFEPPSGYKMHVWSIDGKEVSTHSAMKHTFTAVGNHIVECRASAPEQGPTEGFVRVCYRTKVAPQ